MQKRGLAIFFGSVIALAIAYAAAQMAEDRGAFPEDVA